jgi:hypothetical protein
VTGNGFEFKVIKFGPIEQDRVYREIGRFIFEFSQLGVPKEKGFDGKALCSCDLHN